MRDVVAYVASPGGHVDQAYEIADRFADRADRFWITARTPQTQALLSNETVEWVREVRSRQALRAIRSLGGAMRIMRERRPRLLVSTGSALTVAYMLAARMHRIPVTYVESATRQDGPSVTGRITEWVPGVTRLHQSTQWKRGKWKPFGSIFDAYSVVPTSPRPVRRVLVTLGSERFPFRRALEAVLESSDGLDIVWQTGTTPIRNRELPGDARAWWPGDELAAQARSADVVITHGGVGSILSALRGGTCPVVVPRLSRLGEHIDDHQSELSRVLEKRGVVVVARPGDDIKSCIQESARRSVVKNVTKVPSSLSPTPVCHRGQR